MVSGLDNNKNMSPRKIQSESKHRLLTSLAELRGASEELFREAKHKIQLYTHNLDPRVLSFPRLEQILLNFIRRSRYSRVEILIYNEQNLTNSDHRLVKLAQNFASYVSIRVVPKDFHENPFAFYLVDGRHLLYRTLAERYETEYLTLPNSKLKEKARLFTDIWQQSDPASHLRALHL